MKKEQLIYIIISGLVFLSVILKGCHKPKPEDQYPNSNTDYDPRVSIAVSSISDSSVVISGAITNTTYRTITDCGIYWSTTRNRIWLENNIDNIKLDNFSFCDTLTGLIPNTIYYVAVAVKFTDHVSIIVRGDNSSIISFETLPLLPIVLTSAIIEYTKYFAIVGGMVTDQGMTPLIERGLYWGLSTNPETSGTKTEMGNGLGGYSTKITGLSPNTNYYIKAYATNNNGTGYGSEQYFNSGNDTTFPKVSDVDGNVYPIVTIGKQVWMSENLKTTTYNDNISIPITSDNNSWSALTTPAYCWYNNDEPKYKITFGALYNWYAVSSGKLCPSGWHVPSKDEWTSLSTYLGGDDIAGGKLKESGTTHWLSPNTSATNEIGFTALPGGQRTYTGGFDGNGAYCEWWSSTEYGIKIAWFIGIYNISGYLLSGSVGDDKKSGLSVRCVRDF